MAGIGEKDSIMPFYIMNADVLSTFSQQEAETYRDKHGYKIKKS